MVPFRSVFFGGSFAPVVENFGTAGTFNNISPPAGATTLIIECIGGGAGSFNSLPDGVIYCGGGGAYSRATIPAQAVDVVVGVHGLADNGRLGEASYAQTRTPSAVVCRARGSSGQGGATADSYAIGTIKYAGGDGVGAYYAGGEGGLRGGGGAGGPLGKGGNGGNAIGGAAGGAPAGAGGCPLARYDTARAVGQNYGGGGGAYVAANEGGDVYNGAPGLVRLTWL